MSTISSVCKIHSNQFHFFQKPFCKKQSLLQKIGIVVFHILTFGIPLIFYRLIVCCKPKISSQRGENLQKKAVETVRRNDDYTSYISTKNKLDGSVEKTASFEYLFVARKEGKSQEGCRGSISVARTDAVRQKLQETTLPGISFDPTIYHQYPSIIGTCTAMSLEFASTYFELRKEWKDKEVGSQFFLDKVRLQAKNFEKSTEEIRSRQAAFSSITVDRSVKMDVSKSKIESCVKYHNFEIDICTSELDIVENGSLMQLEIENLPIGVYFIRMLKPMDNHKLEERAHSMIYVREKDISYFYDNNCGLKILPKSKRSNSTDATDAKLLYEQLLDVHSQWNIPITRLYRLKPMTKT